MAVVHVDGPRRLWTRPQTGL